MAISLSGMFRDVTITGKPSPSEPDSDAEWRRSNLKVGEVNEVSTVRDYWKPGNCGGRKGEGENAQEHSLKRPLGSLVMHSGSRRYH